MEQLAPTKDPRQKTGPSTATVAEPDIVPISDKVSPRLPTTVTDAQDTKVTVGSADRTLAFGQYGTLGATVFGLGLGDRMVGRDTSTGFPAAARLPLRLRDSGIPVVVTDSRRAINNVGTLIQQVADALGVQDEGRRLVGRTNLEIEKTKIAVQKLADDSELRTVFLYVRGQPAVHQMFGLGHRRG